MDQRLWEDPEAIDVDMAIAAKHAKNFLETFAAYLDTPEHHRETTPQRMAQMFRQMTEPEEFKFTTFKAESQDMLTVGPIPFYSLCAHHTAPFFGQAYIGCVPDDQLAGLSKFARAVKYCAKGFHVQEDLTAQIADFIEDKLAPRGTAVVLKAEHLCMAMRGVETAGVITTTSSMRGVFGDHERTAKAEFMQFITWNG